MPGDDSLEAIPEIVAETPGTAVVVLTMQSDTAFARSALRAGAKGYVLKEAADDELVQAVRAAASGETYLNPRLGGRLAAEPPEPSGPPDDLTEREVEILRLIALGHTNGEIAAQLYLSVRTVESHRAHIQQKLRRTTPLRARALCARQRAGRLLSAPEALSARGRRRALASPRHAASRRPRGAVGRRSGAVAPRGTTRTGQGAWSAR